MKNYDDNNIIVVLIIDPSLTCDNVAKIMKYTACTMSYQNPACDWLYISTHVVQMVRENCVDEEEENQLVQYWIDFSPYASWSILGGRLLWLAENTALEMAKKFIKSRPGL